MSYLKHRRPWKVFVLDIGPTWSFKTEAAARARARAVVEGEIVIGKYAYGNYAKVLVWETAVTDPFVRLRFTPETPEGIWERLNRKTWQWEPEAQEVQA